MAVFLPPPPAPILGLRTAQLRLASCSLLALTSERMAMTARPHFKNKSQFHLWHSSAVTQKKTTNQIVVFFVVALVSMLATQIDRSKS